MSATTPPTLCAETGCPWPVDHDGGRCAFHSPAVATFTVRATLGGCEIHTVATLDPRRAGWDFQGWHVRHELERSIARQLGILPFDVTVLDYRFVAVRDTAPIRVNS